MDSPLTMEKIREYANSKLLNQLADDVDAMLNYKEKRDFDLLWDIAASSPKRYAQLYDQRFLVIMDEFQNTGRIYLYG